MAKKNVCFIFLQNGKMSKDGIKEFDQTVKRRRTAFAN
jgi:hypothetical protein